MIQAVNQRRPTSVAFNNDGTKMFVTGKMKKAKPILVKSMNTHLIPHLLLHQELLMLRIYNLSSQHSYIDGIVFNYDGTKMYTTDSVDNKINQYKLTTAFILPLNHLRELLIYLTTAA